MEVSILLLLFLSIYNKCPLTFSFHDNIITKINYIEYTNKSLASVRFEAMTTRITTNDTIRPIKYYQDFISKDKHS